MGSGSWSATDYHDRVTAKARAGKDTFDYSADAIRSGNLRPHQTLDPQGLGIRESRDSDEHPDSNSIIISLDVTGSMGAVCRAIHADLPHLHELLLGHKYIPQPQILFAAVGDATCDQVPVQVGQFESDNRMDKHLENMILEGGGGGQKTESYELMLYVAARHTAIDCWEKRRRKGYLFIIGDEKAYPTIRKELVRKVFGEDLGEDIPLKQIVKEVKEQYHLYFVIPGGASHGGDRTILQFWNDAIGADRVIKLDSPEDTSQCIGLTIGINEGVITMNDAVEQMRKRGLGAPAIGRVTGALATVATVGPTITTTDRPRRL